MKIINYFAVAFLGEVDIEINVTVSKKFTRCSNSKCQAIFPFTSIEKVFEDNFLCPDCRAKIHSHHIVECKNCHTLINFIRVEEGEEPYIFNVKKCHNCSGSFEDEKRMQPFSYPDLYM